MDKKQTKLLARFLSEDCFRNSILEDYHSGIFPSTKDKYKDVVVTSPYGDILFNELEAWRLNETKKIKSSNELNHEEKKLAL